MNSAVTTAWFWIKTCTATIALLFTITYLPWVLQGTLPPL